MSLDEIANILNQGQAERAKQLLETFLDEHPHSDEAYFMLGKIYRREENWQCAINNFQKAIDLNPESPAVAAKENIHKILDFFCKDIYNQ